MDLSQVAQVLLTFEDNSQQTRLIPRVDVDMFFEAALKLHHNPGVNPHSGLSTTKLRAMAAYTLRLDGPYWWTMPSLDTNGDQRGARVFQNAEVLRQWVAEEAY